MNDTVSKGGRDNDSDLVIQTSTTPTTTQLIVRLDDEVIDQDYYHNCCADKDHHHNSLDAVAADDYADEESEPVVYNAQGEDILDDIENGNGFDDSGDNDNHKEDDGSLCHLPVASATLLDPLFAPPIDDSAMSVRGRSSSSSRMMSYDEFDPTVDAFVSYSRPELIFVTALIDKKNAGLLLKNYANGGTVVSGLTEDSPFLNSNVHAGDVVVAVNNALCSHLNAKQVAKLIKTSKLNCGTVSICFRNQKGDPSLISCSVQKPDMTAKVGVALRRRRDAIRINRVDLDGLFGNSLLMPRHRCMMINGISCSHMSSKTAGRIIGMATDRVTIISRPEASYALPIALYEPSKWWTKLAIGAGMATGSVKCLSSLS